MKLAVAVLVPAMLGVNLSSADPAQLTIGNQAQVVFGWKNQKCDADTIPDSPARAMRLSDGRILLIAAHYTNRVLIGPSLDKVSIDCAVGSRGDEAADPSQFDDRFWVQSLLRVSDGRVFGFSSHEFHGKRHPGSCDADAAQRVRCWYSSIVATLLDERTLTFKLASPEHRVIAASRKPFSKDGPERSGFFTVSNIAKVGGTNYFLSYQEGMGAGGNCLFRQSQPGNPFLWEALVSGGAWMSFPNPYTNSASAGPSTCQAVGTGMLSGPVMSLFFLEPAAKWVAVFNARPKTNSAGVYYATSADLLTWSPPTLLLASSEARDSAGKCGIFYSYPSLLDQKSTAVNFDSGGTDLWLYVTRYNLTDCHSFMDRDLVRFKVTVAP